MARSLATASFFALALAACVSPQQRIERYVAHAKAACSAMGYEDGTDAMRDCIQKTYQADRANDARVRAAATGALLSRPVPHSITCTTIGNTTNCQ